MDYSVLLNKPKTKKGRETLDRIVSAAAQVFYEKGYHNASINEIADCAGVATGTFYIYFDSKKNLYIFLLMQCSHMIRKFQAEATKDCKTRKEVEEVGFKAWLEFVKKHRYVYNIIWESLYIDKQLFIEYYDQFSKAYINGLESAKLNGEINPSIDTEVLAWTLIGATNFLGLNWGVFHTDAVDSADITKRFMNILSDDIFSFDLVSSVTNDDDSEDYEERPIRIEIEYDD